LKKLNKFLQYIYKKIIYNFFYLYHGKVKGVIEPNQKNEIYVEKISIEKNSYKIYSCKNSIIYTDTIHDTAILKNGYIIEGASFQFRKNINVSSTSNIVFKKGTPRFKKKLNGTVLSLLIGGAGNSNYWHWLFDVLPKIHIFNNSIFSEDKINYYLFPSLEKNFQKETVDLLNISKNKRLSSKFFRHLSADEIIVTDHPYTLLNDPFKDSLNIPLWIVNFLKKKFLNRILDYPSSNFLPKNIYINRKDGHSLRYIINEKEVEVKLKNKGFKSLTMSDYSFIDQIKIFNNAKNIVGLHGAAFANLIFCKPNTNILEIKPYDTGDIIKNLARSNKLRYNDMSLKPMTINLKNQTGDLHVNLDLLGKFF
jgi:capsular polysaccharide biosynthesis protein